MYNRPDGTSKYVTPPPHKLGLCVVKSHSSHICRPLVLNTEAGFNGLSNATSETGQTKRAFSQVRTLGLLLCLGSCNNNKDSCSGLD